MVAITVATTILTAQPMAIGLSNLFIFCSSLFELIDIIDGLINNRKKNDICIVLRVVQSSRLASQLY